MPPFLRRKIMAPLRFSTNRNLIISKLFLLSVAGHKNSGQEYPLLFARYFLSAISLLYCA
jgi:hypothetical protein